jgi:hypothetical protein
VALAISGPVLHCGAFFSGVIATQLGVVKQTISNDLKDIVQSLDNVKDRGTDALPT